MKTDKLKGHIPDSVLGQLPDVIAKFELNTPLRLAHFLAQCGHESGGFKLVQENFCKDFEQQTCSESWRRLYGH